MRNVGMIRAVLLDLAGVVYQGDQPLPGAVDAVAWLRQGGIAAALSHQHHANAEAGAALASHRHGH